MSAGASPIPSMVPSQASRRAVVAPIGMPGMAAKSPPRWPSGPLGASGLLRSNLARVERERERFESKSRLAAESGEAGAKSLQTELKVAQNQLKAAKEDAARYQSHAASVETRLEQAQKELARLKQAGSEQSGELTTLAQQVQ